MLQDAATMYHEVRIGEWWHRGSHRQGRNGVYNGPGDGSSKIVNERLAICLTIVCDDLGTTYFPRLARRQWRSEEEWDVGRRNIARPPIADQLGIGIGRVVWSHISCYRVTCEGSINGCSRLYS